MCRGLVAGARIGAGARDLAQLLDPPQRSHDARQVLSVANTVAGSPVSEVLRVGDLLLAVDGEAVNSFRGLERATQKESVEIVYLRGGVEHTANVATVVPLRCGTKVRPDSAFTAL